MIFDALARLDRYVAAHPNFPEAFRELRRLLGALPEPGRHPLESSGLVALLSDYAPKPPEACRHEVHRRHIDIQVVVEGAEFIGCAPLEAVNSATPFDTEKDIGFFEHAPAGGVVLRPGTFAIFFPEDAHQPGVSHDGYARVRKLVLKVPV